MNRLRRARPGALKTKGTTTAVKAREDERDEGELAAVQSVRLRRAGDPE